MEWLRALIGPDTGDAEAWQLCVRAALLFVFGIVCVRIAGRRAFSKATPADVVVALVVGSNIARLMTGRAQFVGGIAATLVLVILHRLFAMATLRWNLLAKLIKAEPAVLVRDGQADQRAMRRHGISDEDLAESLRTEQVRTLAEVELATLEGGGKISVIPRR